MLARSRLLRYSILVLESGMNISYGQRKKKGPFTLVEGVHSQSVYTAGTRRTAVSSRRRTASESEEAARKRSHQDASSRETQGKMTGFLQGTGKVKRELHDSGSAKGENCASKTERRKRNEGKFFLKGEEGHSIRLLEKKKHTAQTYSRNGRKKGPKTLKHQTALTRRILQHVIADGRTAPGARQKRVWGVQTALRSGLNGGNEKDRVSSLR